MVSTLRSQRARKASRIRYAEIGEKSSSKQRNPHEPKYEFTEEWGVYLADSKGN